MEQTNFNIGEPESRGPIAIFDEFGRITNFFFDEYNILHPWRNPSPRRAYWNKGELIGPPFKILSILHINHWKIVSQI